MTQIQIMCKLLLGLILFLSCLVISSHVKAQAPNWDSVYADYFTIYAPVDTPAWIFPICFKNNFGEWDTVYLGVDNNATSVLDSMLGEAKLIPLDASTFNAFLRTTSSGDSVTKYEVDNLSNTLANARHS